MDSIEIVNRLTSKETPLLRIFLLIKLKVPTNPYFYLVLIIFKFLGLLIITSNFTTNTKSYNYNVATILRSLTLFNYASSLTFQNYSYISLFIFFLLLIGLLIAFKFYKSIKRKDDYLLTISASRKITFISILIIILMIINEHLLEFSSYIYPLFFFISKTNYVLFDNTVTINNNGLLYTLLFTNTFIIIVMNIFNYLLLQIINEPFFNSNFPLRFRLKSYSYCFFMFIGNLQCLNYVELLLDSESKIRVFKYVLLISYSLLCLICYSKSIKVFNYDSFYVELVQFLISYTFFSNIVEFTIYYNKIEVLTFTRIVFLFICKLLITVCYLIMNGYLAEYYFINNAKNSVFLEYIDKVDSKDLEYIYYFMNILIKLKEQKVKDYSKIIKIILEHKTECGVDSCSCKYITNYKAENLKDPLNKIIESIFSKVNLGKDKLSTLLFSEYICIIKYSNLFSFGLLNTFINKHNKSEFSINVFVLLIKMVESYKLLLIKNKDYVDFNYVFNHIKLKSFYEEKIFTFLENYENFVKFKHTFDNTLKVDPDSNKLDSACFTNINSIIDNCLTYQMMYREIKKSIIDKFSEQKCKMIDLSYKIYLFFEIVNRKVPKKLLKLLCFETDYDFKTAKEITKYFDENIENFLNDDKSPHSVIVEVNNSFTIKYISYKLCQILGYNQKELLDKDLHLLLPLPLRDAHKKIILEHFFIRKNTLFNKVLFAYTKSNYTIPINMKVILFPNLDENLHAVIGLKIKKDNPRNMYMVLSDNFELLGLSTNFYSNYFINFELIDKLNIDVIKLFNLGKTLELCFRTQLQSMVQIKQEKNQNNIYSLANVLFNLNLNDDDRLGYVPTPRRLLDKIKYKNGKVDIKIDEIRRLTEVGLSRKPSEYSVVPQVKTTPNMTPSISPELQRKSSIKPKLKHHSIVRISTEERIEAQANSELSSLSRFALQYDQKKLKKSENKGDEYEDSVSSSSSSSNDKNGNEDYQISYTDKRYVLKHLERILINSKDLEGGQKYIDKLKLVIEKMNKNKDENQKKKKSSKLNSNKYKSSYIEKYKIVTIFRNMNFTPFFILKIQETYELIHHVNFTNTQIHMNHLTAVMEEENKRRSKKSLFSAQANDSDSDNSKSKTNTMSSSDDSEDLKGKCMEENLEEEIKKKSKAVEHFHPLLITQLKSCIPGFSSPASPIKGRRRVEFCHLQENLIKDKEKAEVLANLELLRRERKKNKRKQDKKQFYSYMTLVFVLFLNISICFTSFALKIFNIEVTNSYFTISFWNKSQQTSFIALQSSVISYILTLNGMTSFNSNYLTKNNINITSDNFTDIISTRAVKFREDFTNFIQITENSVMNLNDFHNLIFFTNTNLKTTKVSWDSESYDKSLVEMVNFITFNSLKLSVDTEKEKLINDLNDGFFFQNYKKKLFQLSESSKIIYFLLINYLEINSIFQNINDIISQNILEARFNYEVITLSIECLNILLSIVMLFTIFININKFDKSIFKSILSMFLNLYKGMDHEFSSENEVIIMKMRLKSFRQLIKTFSVDNIKIIRETLKLDTKTVQMTKKSFRTPGRPNYSSVSMLSMQSPGSPVRSFGFRSNAPIIRKSSITKFEESRNLNNSGIPFLNLNNSNSNNNFSFNNNNNGGSFSLNLLNDKTNDRAIRKDINEEIFKLDKTKDKKGEVDDLENVKKITNKLVLRNSMIYPIGFIRFAKILILLIFFVFIIFLSVFIIIY